MWQTEFPQKHATIQVWSWREFQSLSLVVGDSSENTCVCCDQVNDLLSLVTELQEEVERKVKERQEGFERDRLREKEID